jgi:hypothetical protein
MSERTPGAGSSGSDRGACRARATLMLIHLPKTAGATLRWIVDRQDADREMLEDRSGVDRGHVRARVLPNQAPPLVVMGHYARGLHPGAEASTRSHPEGLAT